MTVNITNNEISRYLGYVNEGNKKGTLKVSMTRKVKTYFKGTFGL